jgi:hypothetical protein
MGRANAISGSSVRPFGFPWALQKRKSTKTEGVWKEDDPPGSAPLEMSEMISDYRQNSNRSSASEPQ